MNKIATYVRKTEEGKDNIYFHSTANAIYYTDSLDGDLSKTPTTVFTEIKKIKEVTDGFTGDAVIILDGGSSKEK